MSLDEEVKKLFDIQFKSQFPAMFGQYSNPIIARIDTLRNDVDNLKNNLLNIINSAVSKNNELFRQGIAKLKTSLDEQSGANDENKRQINELQSLNRQINDKIQRLSQRIDDLEAKNKYSVGFEAKSSPFVSGMQADPVIKSFNDWAANPAGPLPYGFTFLEGEPVIRTFQNLTETTAKTIWITNRNGGKKYLLPNPNFFDPMTNIRMFYEMDQTMLKLKGANKIIIVTPCEMRSDGWIEFPGELKILP